MSLDGLRAWIGEVERKLGVRTKVMLVLAAIAIGAAGTAIYLVIDYRDKAVSEGDVQQLKTELESTAGAGGSTEVAGLQAEVDALEAQVEELQREADTGGGKGKGDGTGTGTGGAASGGTGGGAGGSGARPPAAEGIPDLPDAGGLPDGGELPGLP